MKKQVLIAIATLFATVSFAQQQLATLNHNDSITVFYGASALQQAHEAAVNGDIVTLSSGTFNAVDITKSISLRGNGMEEDAIAGTTPTIIVGDFSINIPNDSIHFFSMEGIRVPDRIFRHSLTSPRFLKCWIYVLYSTDYNDNMTNATFTNCVIRSVASVHANSASGTLYTNCLIREHSDFGNVNCMMKNCIVEMYRNDGLTCENCIVYRIYDQVTFNTNSFFNCIGVCPNGAFFADTNHNNFNFSSLSNVFAYFNGEYAEGLSLELNNIISSQILGNDGTEIGVYGGMVPFSPRVNTPRFVRCNVAPHTTLDGKLSVDIEVVSE